MKKYVVKNCPAYKGYCTNEFRYGQCLEISDCLIKQIIEICKEAVNNDDPYQRMYAGKMYCEPILELLDIQEVD